ncbi:hypothetical protein SLS58_005381 [Diplodia intermedia]|uniref:Mid2 domain-containing protein n=1 Tax=Diplodia intermedia TaxID=856260 RepID=A0ABR3TR79_9PEZI
MAAGRETPIGSIWGQASASSESIGNEAPTTSTTTLKVEWLKLSSTTIPDASTIVYTVTTQGYTIVQSKVYYLLNATTTTTAAAAASGYDQDATNEDSNTTKIAVGLSIPLGIILIALLLAGAYLWGIQTPRQELPTSFNIAEMPATEGIQEMEHQATASRPLDERVAVDAAQGKVG